MATSPTTTPTPHLPPLPPTKPPTNHYTRRTTAPSASKPCYICHKPTQTVLITPCTRDFFYICPGHLHDRAFAVPAPGEPGASASSGPEAAKKKKDDELAADIKALTAEYAARAARRKAAKKARAKAAEKSNGKTTKDDTDPALDKQEREDNGTESGDEREKEEKIAALRARSEEVVEPKAFVLQRDIYGMRVQRMKDAAAAKRRGEVRARNPGAFTFPAVPRTM